MNVQNWNRRRFLGWCLKAIGTVGLGGTAYTVANFLSRGDIPLKTYCAEIDASGACLSVKKANKGVGLAKDGTVEVRADAIPAGASMIVPLGVTPVIVVHLGKGFKAFNATCTHLGCLVKWDSESNKFICPCHEGSYNSDGQVIAGPPPMPLKKCNITMVEDKIKISVA
jgi:cytochrome b6-f complex iron-sulfur subunit